MDKQLQEKSNSGALAVATDLSAWGEMQTVTAKDVIIPKILPQQHMSEKVKGKLSEYGEFRDTVANRKFGDLETPFEVIPFYMVKTWYEFDIVTNKAGARKREFSRVIPIQDNATKPGYNDDLPYTDEGGKVERDRVMDFYVLIPSEVAAGVSMPYVLSFRRTSLKAGQKIASQMFMTNLRAGKVPAAVSMLISGKDVSNDDGSFVVVDALPNRESTAEEIRECLNWLKMIRAGQTKVDDSDIKEEVKKTDQPIEAAQYGKF
jgi:hypothetical protein